MGNITKMNIYHVTYNSQNSFWGKCTKTIANYSEKAALSCAEVDVGVPPQQQPPVAVVLDSVSVFTSFSYCSSAIVSIRFSDAFDSMFSFPNESNKYIPFLFDY